MLSCGFVCVMLCLAILVEHRLVTHRQAQDHSIYRASIASRGKKQSHLSPNVFLCKKWGGETGTG